MDQKLTARFGNVADPGNFEKKSMKINEDHPHENKQKVLILSFHYSKWHCHYPLHLGDTKSLSKELESFIVGGKEESSVLLWLKFVDMEKPMTG